MDTDIYIKEEPLWYGELPANEDPQRFVPNVKTEVLSNMDHGGLRGIDQLAQSSYSNAINLAHVTNIKQEPQADMSQARSNFGFVDVRVDRVPPSDFSCGPDVDPLQVSRHSATCSEAGPQSRCIKQELPDPLCTSMESGESPHGILQSDHDVDPLQVSSYPATSCKAGPQSRCIKHELPDPQCTTMEVGESPHGVLQSDHDVDPLQVSSYPATSCKAGPQPQCIKQELSDPQCTSMEAGESPHGVLQSDHGMLSSPSLGRSNFCPVIGVLKYDGIDFKQEPKEPANKTTANQASLFEHRSSEVQRNAGKHVASSQFSLQAEPSRVNQATDSSEYTCDTCGEKLGSRSALKYYVYLPRSGGKHKYEPLDVGHAKRGDITSRTKIHGTIEALPGSQRDNHSTLSSKLTTSKTGKSKAKVYACDLCDVRCISRAHLTTHGRTHTKDGDVCEGRFIENSELNVNKSIQKGKKYYAYLITHKRTRTRAEPLARDMCDVRCVSKSSLTVHKRIHAGEKLIACDVCEARFTTNGSFTIHKRIHTGEKTIACDVCEAKFTTNSSLTIHKRIHTG